MAAKRSGKTGKRVRARSMRADFVASFRAAISAGHYAEGERLPPERELAAAYHVSRQTVRKALDELEKDELIRRRVGSGTFVSPRAPADTIPANLIPSVSPLDAIEARTVIEPGFAFLAVPRATDEDFRRMAQRIHEMETAPDQTAFKVAGYEFHLELVRATRNPLLLAMYELLVAARAKAGWETLKALNDTQELRNQQIEGSRAIYQALIERNATKASELSRFYLGEMRRGLMESGGPAAGS